MGGAVISTSSPSSFTRIYLFNALSFLAFGALVAARTPAGMQGSQAHERRGYGIVLRDRVFLAVVGFNALVVFSTYAQLDSSVPLYARVFLGVNTLWLGVILAVNTAFIVFAQLPVARAVRHLDRSQTLALCAGVWTACWLVGALASLNHGVGAAWILGGFAVLFGLGECLLAATIGPLVADLAPAATRGRYMAAFNISWSLGLLAGPAIGGVVVGSRLHSLMWLLWALVALGLVAYATFLGRHLPGAVNRPPATT